MSNNHEFGNYTASPEISGEKTEAVETALETIDKTKQFVAENLDLGTDEELDSVTKEALSYVAERTFEDSKMNGDIDGTKKLQMKKAVEAVIVGTVIKNIPGSNPILDLKKAGLGQEVDTAIKKFKETDAKLPNGEDIAEKVGEFLGVPEVLFRGERRYLNNIDQVGKEPLSTKGYERTSNQEGKVYSARDIEYARSYSVGTDGVEFYDGPRTAEEIPIGVIYKINNENNIISATPDGEPVPDNPALGDIAGKYREFISGDIPSELCEVVELQIMDDYNQPNGHTRSDFRQVLETFIVESPEQLLDAIKKVKARIYELDAQR